MTVEGRDWFVSRYRVINVGRMTGVLNFRSCLVLGGIFAGSLFFISNWADSRFFVQEQLRQHWIDKDENKDKRPGAVVLCLCQLERRTLLFLVYLLIS